jgi:uroporphyrinogen-III synthase
MRVLVTRPADDSARTAEALRAAGHEPLVVPLFEIQPLAHAMPQPVDAFIATSANALRQAQLTPENCTVPVYTVGDATAAAAKVAGFGVIHSARGDSTDLAALLKGELKPGAHIAYLAGIPRQDDALQALSGQFRLSTLETYRTIAVETVPEGISAGLASGQIDAILHFSPRSAQIFADLIDKAELFAKADRVVHVFISQAADIPRFARRKIASRPNLAAMIAALDAP